MTIASVASTGGSIETLSINSVSQNGTMCTNTITGPSPITVDTVIITGNQDLVAGAWTGANTDNIDASAFTGDLTVSSAIAGAVINGGSGDDTLTGGAGIQILNGNEGTDTLTGAAGADQLTGGAGADTFVVVIADVPDTIIDFTPGADDFNWDTALLSKDSTNTVPHVASAFQSAAAGTAILGPTTVFELTGTTVAAPYAAANVVAALGATATDATITAGDRFLFVVYYDDGRAAIWSFDAAGANVTAAELTLAAELAAPITADSLDAGDFI